MRGNPINQGFKRHGKIEVDLRIEDRISIKQQDGREFQRQAVHERS